MKRILLFNYTVAIGSILIAIPIMLWLNDLIIGLAVALALLNIIISISLFIDIIRERSW